MVRFFTFEYAQYDDGQIVNNGKNIYYTSASAYRIDEMRGVVRESIRVPNAVITIEDVTEVTREEYSLFKNNGLS